MKKYNEIRAINIESLIDFINDLEALIDPKHKEKFDKLRTDLMKELI